MWSCGGAGCRTVGSDAQLSQRLGVRLAKGDVLLPAIQVNVDVTVEGPSGVWLLLPEWRHCCVL